MQTVYCITGLGADENVFQYLNLSYVKPVFTKWISPFPDETLSGYAIRIKQQFIHEPNPIIIGLSLGGMLAVEIAKSNPSGKIIIISSAKTIHDIPFYVKIFKYIPVYKAASYQSIRKSFRLQQYFLGAHSTEAKKYVKDAMKKADFNFYKWAVQAIVTWQNKTVPSNVIHLHGRKDNLLPFRFVNADIEIKNGGHLMIIENAEEISLHLKNIICNTQ